MGRTLRVDYPGLHYHVMARGNNKQAAFLDGADHEFMEHLLTVGLGRFGFSLHAYCLMTNHLHLLLESSQGNLGEFMDWLLGRYARRFNWRHKRIGHLFQARYLSRVVAKESYLLEVSRYIHMNPVKAGMVARPEDYRWSSVGAYYGGGARVPVETGRLLGYFGGPDAENDLRAFTAARAPREPRESWYAQVEPAALERTAHWGVPRCTSTGGGTFWNARGPAKVAGRSALWDSINRPPPRLSGSRRWCR
jgi:REP element-mobilizing transposase RayT